MSVTWTISVGDRSYGPYTLDQMKAFQAEGRLAPHSLVAYSGEEKVRHASEDTELALLFASPARQETAAAEVFPSEPPPGPAKFGRDSQSSGARNRYIIIADMKSGSISALEEEIFNFGPSFRFMPQSWLLISEVSLSTLRSELIQKLGKLDMLIVADTSNDKAAWFNFGPEADTKMRRLWQRDPAPVKNSA
jgi:hypothetical protein